MRNAAAAGGLPGAAACLSSAAAAADHPLAPDLPRVAQLTPGRGSPLGVDTARYAAERSGRTRVQLAAGVLAA